MRTIGLAVLGFMAAGCGPWQGDPGDPGGGTATGPFCGGIAGIPCPGAGTCVDDPSDDCDPNAGGADCGGVCECTALGLCVEGMVWDSNPEVCDCVPAEPEVDACATVRCAAGTHCVVVDDQAVCESDELTNPCAAVLCLTGTTCEVVNGQAECVPIDSTGSEACGDVTCAEGEVCCNASCGICTPPDGACIQIACE